MNMREMKDSGIEWIGNIPNDWIIGKIKNYAALKTGSTPNTNITEWFDGEINWFTPSDFTDDYILSKSIRSLSIKAISDNVVSLLPKSIVMIIGIGGTAGKVGFTVTEGYCNQQVTALIPKNISPKYLMYWLVTNTIPLRKTALYTTLPIINNQTIGNYVCISPSKLSEQKEIVNYLDNECAKLHSLISDIQSQIEALEEYKRSVITEAVTKGLDPDVEMRVSGYKWCPIIPKHWHKIPSKYLFVSSDIRKYPDDVLLTASQRHGIISQTEYMERENAKIVLANQGIDNWKHVEPNDFIISLRSFQGGLELSEVRGCITWHYIVLKATKPIIHKYYKWLFKSFVYIKALQGTCNFIRDGQDLRYSNFVQVPIFQPPMEEQQQIADYLDSKCAEVDSIIAEKKQQIETIEEYKKSLIFEYVTGKKEVPIWK